MKAWIPAAALCALAFATNLCASESAEVAEAQAPTPHVVVAAAPTYLAQVPYGMQSVGETTRSNKFGRVLLGYLTAGLIGVAIPLAMDVVSLLVGSHKPVVPWQAYVAIPTLFSIIGGTRNLHSVTQEAKKINVSYQQPTMYPAPPAMHP